MGMGELPFKHFTVIGLGLIGGSLAMAVRERFPDWRVTGVDPNAEALAFALRHDVIHEAAPKLPETFADNHLIVIACHLSPSLEVLEQLVPRVQGRDILVTDIGSCKREITELGQKLLPRQFIAGHPMAGKEFSGVQHATSLLFASKSYLLCPHAETPPERLEQLSEFVKSLGANPRLIDATRHDFYMTYVSHLPQMYSVLLANLLGRHDPERLLAYYGGGLDGQLRLAASPFSMWGDVFKRNADNMKAALNELRNLIDDVLPLLEQSDADDPASGLGPWFARSNEIHRQFETMKANPKR
jgi:prephenate dehydrogenase